MWKMPHRMPPRLPRSTSRMAAPARNTDLPQCTIRANLGPYASVCCARSIEMTDTVTTRYSGGEELANALTHALGVVLSVIGFTCLLGTAGVAESVRVLAS